MKKESTEDASVFWPLLGTAIGWAIVALTLAGFVAALVTNWKLLIPAFALLVLALVCVGIGAERRASGTKESRWLTAGFTVLVCALGSVPFAGMLSVTALHLPGIWEKLAAYALLIVSVAWLVLGVITLFTRTSSGEKPEVIPDPDEGEALPAVPGPQGSGGDGEAAEVEKLAA